MTAHRNAICGFPLTGYESVGVCPERGNTALSEAMSALIHMGSFCCDKDGDAASSLFCLGPPRQVEEHCLIAAAGHVVRSERLEAKGLIECDRFGQHAGSFKFDAAEAERPRLLDGPLHDGFAQAAAAAGPAQVHLPQLAHAFAEGIEAPRTDDLSAIIDQHLEAPAPGGVAGLDVEQVAVRRLRVGGQAILGQHTKHQRPDSFRVRVGRCRKRGSGITCLWSTSSAGRSSTC